MANYTPEARNNAVQALLKQGFRVAHSNDEFTMMCKSTTSSTMLTAQVWPDGTINTKTLDEFLKELLEN